MNNKSTVVSTPVGISYVRLASLKGMVKLESVGMKSRGGAIRPRIAGELGLSARASYQQFTDTIQSKMEELLQQAQKEETA